jgi:hypothetical protein
MACQSSEEVISLNNSWEARGDSYKRKIWDLLTDAEKLRVRQLLHPRKFNEGQWVRLADTKDAQKIVGASFFVDENQWVYEMEGTEKTFFEGELEVHPDYVNYSLEF